MMDGQVLTAPSVREQIDSDTCVITGDFTAEEANSLAANIKSGQLPFTLQPDEVRVVSATLGEEALNQAVLAGIHRHDPGHGIHARYIPSARSDGGYSPLVSISRSRL